MITHLPLGGEVSFSPEWLTALESQALFATLLAAVSWGQGSVSLFGRAMLEPRLTAWYGDADYTYSGRTVRAAPWSPEMAELCDRVSRAAGASFNAVLLNLYRDGNDSVGWHSDDEPELGANPTIASISLGAPRRFVLAPKQGGATTHRFELGPGSLLVMSGACQQSYRHAVPKTSRPIGPRINLTFRHIEPVR
jgi:alkylated DNA repair dioxygenase AlkB